MTFKHVVEKTGGNDRDWTFECQTCGFTRDVDLENDALDTARDHHNHAGHWNFEIRDPEGVAQYP